MDRAFCASKVEKHTCGRELSEEDTERAKEMGLPIAYGNFCFELSFEEKKQTLCPTVNCSDPKCQYKHD